MIGLQELLVSAYNYLCVKIFTDLFILDWESKSPITPAVQPAIPCDLNLEDCGAGRFLTLSEPMTITETVQRVKAHLDVKHIHVALARNATTGIVNA
jgi:putative NIF3 family GTP cyclohydrolase 1 type 2